MYLLRDVSVEITATCEICTHVPLKPFDTTTYNSTSAPIKVHMPDTCFKMCKLFFFCGKMVFEDYCLFSFH